MPKRRGQKAAAFFTVSSEEISADEISKVLGIKLDRAVVKGAPNPKGNTKLHLLHIAMIRSKGNRSAHIEEHLEDLVAKLSPLREKIKKISKNCGAAICVQYDHEGKEGGWEFSPEMLKKLASFGVPCVVSLDKPRRGN